MNENIKRIADSEDLSILRQQAIKACGELVSSIVVEQGYDTGKFGGLLSKPEAETELYDSMANVLLAVKLLGYKMGCMEDIRSCRNLRIYKGNSRLDDIELSKPAKNGDEQWNNGRE